ncbi:M4 family metallopeptidase [Phaeacidiphilus oryzae]|uniref:M4 family metallopeptidase n=1 Tax=Phaeacidiphilus oryzae TaxID=348818 RepID=UPI000690E2A4|nr:M4 family metallopeptidase [Phaeacidiphilus oryzae]
MTELDSAHRRACCRIVPPHLLERLALAQDETVREAARQSLTLDHLHRRRRSSAPRTAVGPADTALDRPLRSVADAECGERLPGRAVRAEGARPTSDPQVNRVYDAMGRTFDFLRTAFRRSSLDGQGLPLDATVHYGPHYANAFWNGERLVIGDGDGVVFRDLTACPELIAHELAHGLVQFGAGLEYHGQSGALAESLADVFASLAKQHQLGQTAEQADWLIGSGLFADGLHGAGLRSLREPGTAYDDPLLGRDPQPATMEGFVRTTDDDGGVHVNSGIPNHAFFLLADALGGDAAERAGRIWYEALTGGRLAAGAGFAEFAAATAAAARDRYGPGGEETEAVVKAWGQVGVTC